MRGLAVCLMLLSFGAAAQSEPGPEPEPEPEATPVPEPAPTPAPATKEQGFAAGCEAAYDQPIYDWILIGGGASLLTSGYATPCVPAVPYLIDRPRRPAPPPDESLGGAYVLGYREGYTRSLKKRRAAAGFAGAVTVAACLAIGYGIVVEYRAREEREKDGEASLVQFRF